MDVLRWAMLSTIVVFFASSQAQAEVPRSATEMTARVDELLEERLTSSGVTPGEIARDAEFLRRAYLDLTGRIPRVNEVRSFLNSSEADRRAALIQQLLSKPTHATHLANRWTSFLLPEGADQTNVGNSSRFNNWLRQQFHRNRPYDEIVREIVLARGQAGQGATQFYVALENKPALLAAATSRAFLGVQIECAQCHDHPHDKWRQSDFWGYAAFFARLQNPTLGPQTLQILDVDSGEVLDPKTQQPVSPRFLQGEVAMSQNNPSRREQLADWLTHADNPYFARTIVNRCWALLFGRGIVEPVDDFGEHNPPSHPELMQELADYFLANDCDVRNLLSVLANTQAYQRTSQLRDGETPPAPDMFARMAIKTLTAEQLYDCLTIATCRRDDMNAGRSEVQSDRQERANFLEKFRAPAGSVTEFHGGIPQALTLMNGPLITQAFADKQGILSAVEAPFFSNRQRIETLFLATLSRPPAADEQGKFESYLESKLTDVERKQALSDMLWALLNSGEFSLNH